MLWSFLYSRFDKDARVADRNINTWELLHFPLSFGLLLLLSAITVSVYDLVSEIGPRALTAQECSTRHRERNRYDSGT
jgi:hypothetical protein